MLLNWPEAVYFVVMTKNPGKQGYKWFNLTKKENSDGGKWFDEKYEEGLRLQRCLWSPVSMFYFRPLRA